MSRQHAESYWDVLERSRIMSPGTIWCTLGDFYDGFSPAGTYCYDFAYWCLYCYWYQRSEQEGCIYGMPFEHPVFQDRLVSKT